MQATTMTYRCPHCNRAAEFDHVSDGDVVHCPFPDCAQEFRAKLPEATPEPALIVPGNDAAATEQPVATATAVPAEKPSEEEATVFSHESEEQPVLAVYYTPMFTRHPFRFFGYVLVCLVGLLGMIAGIANNSTPFIILSAVTVLIGLGMLAAWWVKTRRMEVAVTPVSLVISDGVFSERKVEVHHQNITDIAIYQPPVCRVFGTGALFIRWGAEPDQSVYIDSVSEPHALVQQVRELAQK